VTALIFSENSYVIIDMDMIKSIFMIHREELHEMSTAKLLAPILSFLQSETPDAWVNEAIKKENLSVLLTQVSEFISKVKNEFFIILTPLAVR
jgi:tRNA isopentenyl-2-thiomethyl-A-37 hydroxylase MiaE